MFHAYQPCLPKRVMKAPSPEGDLEGRQLVANGDAGLYEGSPSKKQDHQGMPIRVRPRRIAFPFNRPPIRRAPRLLTR
jgi:hypothetical protein